MAPVLTRPHQRRLSDGAPPPEPRDPGGHGGGDWALLTVAANQVIAYLIRGRLAEEGIEVVLDSSNASPGAWLHPFGDPASPVRVFVRRAQLTEASLLLHEVDQVFAGPIFYNLEDAESLFRMFDEFIQDAPEQFGGFPAFQIAPPLPFIPENRHGDTLALAVVHWAGPLDQAEKVLKPFMDVAPIVANGAGPLPYPALNGAFDGLYPKGIRAYWKGAFVQELPEAAIAAHVEHGSRVPEVSATMHLYPINGACHRVGPNDTAFAYREATYGMVFLAAWNDPAKDAERIQWVRDYHQAMAPYSEPGGYINFMQDDDYGKIQANYRQNYDRLVQVKRKYDSDNLFHINQNIAP